MKMDDVEHNLHWEMEFTVRALTTGLKCNQSDLETLRKLESEHPELHDRVIRWVLSWSQPHVGDELRHLVNMVIHWWYKPAFRYYHDQFGDLPDWFIDAYRPKHRITKPDS